MKEDKEQVADSPIINTEKLSELLSIYKFPLIFGVVGLSFLIVAIGLLIKSQSLESEVIFDTESSSSAKMTIRVDVVGEVERAGVYELEQGSRVADALSAAGGLSVNADRDWTAKNLNRAAKLVDGGKIYIPSAAETTSGKTQNLSNLGNLSHLVNLNTASQTELEALPGIGPVTAGKIIAGRPYQNIEELKEKKIVANALFEKIRDKLSVY